MVIFIYVVIQKNEVILKAFQVIEGGQCAIYWTVIKKKKKLVLFLALYF